MRTTIKCEYTAQGKKILSGSSIKNLWKNLLRDSKLIYKGRNEIRAWQIDGQKISIKKYGKPPIFNRFLYSVGIRTPKAIRSYRNAQQIIKRGFHTAVPLGYEVHYQNGILRDSYFISLWEDGTPVGTVRKTGPLVRALAEYTVALHNNGMMHRDYMQHNILFTKHEDSHRFSLIDINRFLFLRKPLGWFYTCVNLMQPFPSDKQLKIFVTEYARLRQINENVLIWWVLRFRHIRNGYSALRHCLHKLPGAHYFSRKAKRHPKS